MMWNGKYSMNDGYGMMGGFGMIIPIIPIGLMIYAVAR